MGNSRTVASAPFAVQVAERRLLADAPPASPCVSLRLSGSSLTLVLGRPGWPAWLRRTRSTLGVAKGVADKVGARFSWGQYRSDAFARGPAGGAFFYLTGA